MYYHRIILGSFLVLLSFLAFGQGYQAAETRMPNNLIKDFIQMHIEYPDEAFKNKEEGVVFINFKINKEGSVSEITIDQSVSKSVDDAALKLFNRILWKPATYLGKPIDGESNFKIKYNIKRYVSLTKKRGYDKIPLPHEPISELLEIYTVKELDKAPEAIINDNYSSVQEFITQNLKLPDAALKLNLTGYVKIRFIIEPYGLPSNIMVIEPLGGGCTEEAIRIVQMIKWMPGIKHNEAVRTCYNLAFKFDPANEIKSKHIPNQSNTGI